MADDFDDFINNLDDGTLHNSALSLSKLLALDDETEDGGFEKLLGRLNDKDLEEIIDLDTLEQLEHDLMADEAASSNDSPPQPSSPPRKVKRADSPEPATYKHHSSGKGKRVKAEETSIKKEAVKVYCICRQPQNNRFMICCDRCEEWYHGDCVGISLERGRQMEKNSEDYTCAKCTRDRGAPPALQPAPSSVHIPSSLREKAKSLKVATVVPTKHYSADAKYNRFDSYDTVDRSTTPCKIDGCPEFAMKNSPFCSEKCVLKFAQDNMKSSTSSKAVKSERSESRDGGRYEEKKLSQPNPLRLGVRKHLKTFLSTRAKEATDLLVTEDEIVKIAQNIEMSLYKLFPDCGNRYKAKCKAICFNISDSKNVNLYRNILSGTLSSEKLAKMSAEEMSVRVKTKQMAGASSSDATATDNTVNIMDMLGDTTAQHGTHVFDVKCRKCTSKAPKQKPPAPAPPDTELNNIEPIVNRTAISSKPQKDPLGLNPALWKGYITMTSLTKFATSGYHVYGPHESLLSTLPDTLHVQGRIANNIVWAYVDRLRKSPVKELIILKFESQNGEEVQGYSNLFHYLHTRTRCGVIGNVTAPVRDMYLVPISAEGAMPPQLRLLGVASIPKKNRANLILGLIVINKVGAKRPRDPIPEDIPPDDGGGDDGPPSPGQDMPGGSSLDHLSTFPTDVSMPLHLGPPGAAGGLMDEGSDDDDGLNDIDMILRNNLPIGEVPTDGAGHCRDAPPPPPHHEEEAAPATDCAGEAAMRVVPSYNHTDTVGNFPAPDTPYGYVDGKPILSPLTPLAPPALSFHPEDGPAVPAGFATDYSPISPAAKHAFLNQPARTFTSPPNAAYTDTSSNYSNKPSNLVNGSSNYSNNLNTTAGNPKMLFQSNQQTPKSVYPNHQGSPGFANPPDMINASRGYMHQPMCSQNGNNTDPNYPSPMTPDDSFTGVKSYPVSTVQTSIAAASVHQSIVPSPQKMAPRHDLHPMPPSQQMWVQKVVNPTTQHFQQMPQLSSHMPVNHHQSPPQMIRAQKQVPVRGMMRPEQQQQPIDQVAVQQAARFAPRERVLLPRQTAVPRPENFKQDNHFPHTGGPRFRGQLRGSELAIPPNLAGMRTPNGVMSAQQQAVLRQASQPICTAMSGVTMSGPMCNGGQVAVGTVTHVAPQGIYFNQPTPQTFVMPNSRQPVAMTPAMAHRPVVYQLGTNQTQMFPGNMTDSLAKTNSKAASSKRIKAKLKSKIDRNKAASPKVKTNPKLFDGDSLLAQLEEVT